METYLLSIPANDGSYYCCRCIGPHCQKCCLEPIKLVINLHPRDEHLHIEMLKKVGKKRS
jgi:hypothetical protein